MIDCNAVSTPIEKISNNSDLSSFSDISLFRSAVGSLMFLSVATRPDITFAVNYVAQSLQKPSLQDWGRIKRIFKYLKRINVVRFILW